MFRGSYARIVGNDISHNGANGVNVRESSSAQISDNTLNGNGANGWLPKARECFLVPTPATDLHAAQRDHDQQRRFRNPVSGRRLRRRPIRYLNGDGGPESCVEGCVPSLIR